MCGSDTSRPSVLWDNLTALQPATLKEAHIALFIRKLPRHISAMINTKSFDTTLEMVQRCNQLWASQTPITAHAWGGSYAHMCASLCSPNGQPAIQAKYTYSTLLAVSLLGCVVYKAVSETTNR